MVLYEKTKAFLKRTPTIVDSYEGVQRFDSDNLYPQRVDEIRKRSYTLKSLMNRIADFINGEGFLDPTIATLIVNDTQTLNDILNKASLDFACYDSICLHIGYDLNLNISSITYVPFKYARLGLQNDNGEVDEILYSTNWEKDGRSGNSEAIVTYPICNFNKDVVANQIINSGGIENYKGQLFYATPTLYEYPLATFDAVLDYAQAQSELGIGKVSNIQNQFLSTLAIIYPGEFESQKEEADFKALIANKSGTRNSGSRIGIQDKSGTKKASDIFQSLTPTNIDRLYEYTEKSIVDAIMENEAWPKDLLGVRPETGMFNQANMEESYTYATAITRNRRTRLSRLFSNILKYWATPIFNDCKIIPQRYLADETLDSGLNVNDNLKNMTGMQAVNFARILRKYSQKKYTRDVAVTMLRGGFGLNDEEINKLLDGIDTAAQEDGELEIKTFMALTKQYL